MNAILLTFLLTAGAPQFEALTLDGQTLAGPLGELGANRLTIQTQQGPVAVPIEKLVKLSRKHEPSAAAADGICVQCRDGSLVLARHYTARGDRASLTLLGGQVLELPLRAVLAVRLQRDSGPVAAEWKHLLKTKRDSDLLVVRKNDALDYHQGVAHDVTAEAVRFDLEGEVVSAPRAKVFGLVYHHSAEGELPPLLCRISDIWGSQWPARAVALADALQWTTLAGIQVSLPQEQVVDLDFSAGKIVYLSDLEPESVRWTPFFAVQKSPPALEQFYAPRQDRGFDSAVLQLGGVQYSKGLALHSRTELTYRLPAGFRWFRAVAGIDDSVRPSGKARLVARGDAKPLLETTLAGNEPPRSLELDVAGVRRLVILADFSDVAGGGDLLLLCNARISK
jgi:hypothetical protein